MDPEFKETRRLLEERWQDRGFDRLLPEEQDFVVLWWLEAEVLNGGFHQYFFNSAGDGALRAVAALDTLGAPSTAGILREALSQLACTPYLADTEKRRDHLAGLEQQWSRFDAVTDRLQDFPEDFVSLAIARVQSAHEENGIF